MFIAITFASFIMLKSNDIIKHESMHDQLTGLRNRNSLDETMQQLFAAAKRNDHKVGVLLLDLNKFKEINTEVLSISVDSVFVHKMWNDNELSKMVNDGVKFPMLSDQSGAIGKLYGVYDEDSGVEMRGRFLIDPDGIVQGYEVLTPSVGRNISETIRQLKAFQYVRESKGTEATPSGWEPGSKTLKPNPNLVGNVWKEWKPSSES